MNSVLALNNLLALLVVVLITVPSGLRVWGAHPQSGN